jgi:hypothetical protein
MKLLPFLLLLAAVLGCRQMAEKPQTETRPPEPAQAVDARTLIADYKANEVSADGHYRGKLLEVTGVVHVSLKDGNDGFLTIDCAFTDYDPHVRGLSADIPATLYGVGDGMTLNLYVGLTDCKVK